MMLSAVRSRCTTPRRWATASTSATVAAVDTASGQGSDRPSASRLASTTPVSSSITTYGTTVPSGRGASPKS